MKTLKTIITLAVSALSVSMSAVVSAADIDTESDRSAQRNRGANSNCRKYYWRYSR